MNFYIDLLAKRQSISREEAAKRFSAYSPSERASFILNNTPALHKLNPSPTSSVI